MRILIGLLIVVMIVGFVMAEVTSLDKVVSVTDNKGCGDVNNIKVEVKPGIFDNGIQFVDGVWMPVIIDNGD